MGRRGTLRQQGALPVGNHGARGAQALVGLILGLELINVREPPELVDLACDWLGMPYQKWSRGYLKTQPSQGVVLLLVERLSNEAGNTT